MILNGGVHWIRECGSLSKLCVGLLFLGSGCLAPLAAAGAEEQAVLSLLPPAERAGATLVSYASGEKAVVRPGTGRFVCELDTPEDDQFGVSCYVATLEPYMERDRELRCSGMSTPEAREQMARELEAGTLTIPTGAYQVYASGERPAPDELPSRLKLVHLVYLPMRQAEEVGLPGEEPEVGPWLHNAGTVDAHVMWSEERVLP